MPYTKKELKENEFWQRLNEQDRVNYQNKLEHALILQDAVEVIDENLGKIQLQPTQPLRNEGGMFLAFEDPDTGMNYERPDQYITVNKLSPIYYGGDIRDKVLDREIKELM